MNKLIEDNKELQHKFLKLFNYYMNLQNLIILYLEQLLNYIEDKNKKELIEKKILIFNNLDNKLELLIQKIEFDNNLEIFNIIILYNDFLLLNHKFQITIELIKSIDVFDEKTLLSDTTKNNINQNKIVILDMYNKIAKKLELRLDILIEISKKEIQLTEDLYHKLHYYYLQNPLILNLYIPILKTYLLNKSDNFNDKLKLLILYNNELDKNHILINNLSSNIQYKDKLSILFNKNNIKDFNYLLKSSPSVIKNNNKISKFNYFNTNKRYVSLQELFKDIQNSNFQIKSNELNKSTLESLQKIVNDLYKIEKQYLNITIIESNIEQFNYNCYTLLNSDFVLNKDIGINNKYINKTKTIITDLEYNNLEKQDNDYKNDMYLQSFDKLYNINNFQLRHKMINNKHKMNDDEHLDILLESQYLLIVKVKLTNKKFEFHIMQHSNDTNIYMNFNQIKELLQNKPNYLVENYNIYRNNKLIEKINNNNMLNEFQLKIQSDYKNVKKIDNLELKNQILNQIKLSIKKINKDNKDNNINNIINIIINKLYNYIKKQNNIEFSSEIYLTYFSNINSLIIKIKKELNDNYNQDLLNNIDNILNNIYSNILTINNNILDKYYLTQL